MNKKFAKIGSPIEYEGTFALCSLWIGNDFPEGWEEDKRATEKLASLMNR